uniref:Protein kinase domain-containing protein n=1 Tax=Schistosoma mansoni TaxID=6183 RepID=A0A5K4F7H3_SCHMA
MEEIILKIAFHSIQLNELNSYKYGIIIPLNKHIICKQFNLNQWPIKKLWKKIFQNLFHLKLIQRFHESKLLLSNNNEGLIVPYEIGLDDRKFTIITSFYSYGNLFEWFQQRSILSMEDACTVIEYLCKAVNYLHERHIYHGNIKPYNIFLKTDHPKSLSLVLDFSVLTEINLLCNTNTTTNNNSNMTNLLFIYWSPEYMNDIKLTNDYINATTTSYNNNINKQQNIYELIKALWNKKSMELDSWSIGIIMHLLFTGKLPFLEHKNLYDFLNYINTTTNTTTQIQLSSLLLLSKIDKSIYEIVTMLLNIDINKRYNYKQLLTTYWYSDTIKENKQRDIKSIIEYNFLTTFIKHQMETENIMKQLNHLMKNTNSNVQSSS